MKLSIKTFIAAIAIVGVLRFALTVTGVPNSVTRFASMSFIILIGAAYFAINSSTHGERLKLAYLLILPYMIVEVAALLYTWSAGVETIFHAPQYSLNTTIPRHTFGHLLGGLTWEPALVFLFMELVWAFAAFAQSKLGLTRT
jgi:hypothetical protein